MAYLPSPPPDYIDYNSYSYKRWVNLVYNLLASMVNVVNVTTTYTARALDGYIRADATSAGFTITLPPAADNVGRKIIVKKVDGGVNVVTIGVSGTDTIQGSATKTLTTQWDTYTFVSNGNNGWEIV